MKIDCEFTITIRACDFNITSIVCFILKRLKVRVDEEVLIIPQVYIPFAVRACGGEFYVPSGSRFHSVFPLILIPWEVMAFLTPRFGSINF